MELALFKLRYTEGEKRFVYASQTNRVAGKHPKVERKLKFERAEKSCGGNGLRQSLR
jgi:hypothetical protein